MEVKKEEELFAEERKYMIVDLVNKNYKATVMNLCNEFSVSPSTIRNDLRDLARTGLLTRIYGGAISNNMFEFGWDEYDKGTESLKEKKTIAKAALKYIKQKDTIALDTGTTTFELAKLLINYNDLTIITNDIRIAAFLERFSDSDIIIAGGAILHNFHCTVGKKVVDTLRGININTAFLSANGINLERGATTNSFEIANIKSLLSDLSEKRILLADSNKLGKCNHFSFMDFSQIDLLITDSSANKECIKLLKQKGFFIEICESEC